MTQTTFEFISQLKKLNINLETDGKTLRCHAPEGALTPDLRGRIAQHKAEIILLLQEAKQVKSADVPSIQRISRDQEIPLSFAQQRLWFLHQLSPDSQSYNLLEALQLEGRLNITALEQSLNELLNRHEILRTTFPTVEGKPIQRILPFTPVKLPLINLQDLLREEQNFKIQQMAKSFASESFDLAVEPAVKFKLIILNSENNVLLLKMHHIIYDGWSLNIFFNELSQLYAAFSQELGNPLSPLSIQYADFAVWQRQWLTGEVLERQLNYSTEELAGVPLVLELPNDKPRPPVQSFQGGVKSFQINRDLSQRLKQLSQESEATLFMTLLAAFFILMSRYSNQLDLLVGTPIANRNNKNIEQLIGFFANTLALRGNLSGNPSFRDFLTQVRQTTLSAYAHQDLPFEMLVEKLQPERDLSRNPLVQVIFSLQNTPQSDSRLSGLKMQSIPLSTDVTVRFDLEVNVWENSAGFEAVFSYSTDLFDGNTIARMGKQFQTLLESIVTNPKSRISELSILSASERDQLLIEWNNTQTDYPQDKCIHQLFEEQVKRTPDAVAVIFEDQQITYSELNCRANQLAYYLRSLGIGAEVCVGLCVERSIEMVVGILGILKAGGAYVPLDPAYPEQRLVLMLEESKTSLLLTQSHLQQKLPTNITQTVLALDTDWDTIAPYPQDNLPNHVHPDNLAQIIYTSGSTGTPKGTEVLHRSIIGFTFGVQNLIPFYSEQVFLQYSSMSWDALTLELWPPLLHGGCCVLYPAQIPTPEGLSEIIQKHQVNILWMTAAFFNLMIDTLPQGLFDIKQLMIGGDTLSVTHVRRALELLPRTQIINGYGPSECTVFTCCYLIPEQLETNIESIPIGRKIANAQVYILDPYLQPVPIGVPGELYIGGAGLARGYFNRPELTNEKFISSPFDHSILYKTGDLVRYLPDGNIEYISRIDNQVKIRGFRIELGEIEARLNQHRDVQACCVIVREDTPGDKQLVAYIVPQNDVTLTAYDLRQFLADQLPNYMMPSAFVLLESLPLTTNGKVDRRALKPPTQTHDSDRFIEARNQLELQLVQIWAKVLKTDKISVQDNFFDLGGHSLLASYLMTQIKQQFGKDIPLTNLFQNPTIEQLATMIQKDSDHGSPSCLVPIQPHGSKLPFFCVPGAGGKPFYFYNLARYLGDDQPFYSFENNLYQEFGAITRLEEIAKIYVEALQTIQPQGPYFLGGHSYGGNLAFEMGKVLIKQGEKVALLAVIDASAPTYKDKQFLLDYLEWDHARWLVEVSKGIEIYLDKTVDLYYETLQSLTVEEQLNYALHYFKLANILPPNAEVIQLTNIVQSYKNSCLCLVDYVPQEMYPGQLTILRAQEDLIDDPNYELASEICSDQSLGWSEFCTQPVDIHFVLGNHVSIMAEPHVKVLAEQLKVCIQQAQN